MMIIPLQVRPSPEYPGLQVYTASALSVEAIPQHTHRHLKSNFPYFKCQCHVQKFPTFDRKDLHLTLLCPLHKNTFNLMKRHTRLLINHGCKLFLV